MALIEKLLLSSLRAKNPEIAKMLQDSMNSGMSPKQAFNKFINNGNLNVSQLKEVKNFAKRFGLNIPDSEIQNLSDGTAPIKRDRF